MGSPAISHVKRQMRAPACDVNKSAQIKTVYSKTLLAMIIVKKGREWKRLSVLSVQVQNAFKRCERLSIPTSLLMKSVAHVTFGKRHIETWSRIVLRCRASFAHVMKATSDQ